MGGGLGHLFRTLAILKNAPSLHGRVRVLATAPPPDFMTVDGVTVDAPPKRVLNDRRAYYAYLVHYFENHRIRAIVIDTFPGGIVGELSDLFKNHPRLLLARHLDVEQYGKRLGKRTPPKPVRTLVIEPLPEALEPLITPLRNTTRLSGPLAPADLRTVPVLLPRREVAAVVHSREGEELGQLKRAARRALSGASVERVDVITPQHNPMLFYQARQRYTTIVSGAGYNMAALARLALPHQRHILVPFERRFDDQFSRARRVARTEPGTETNQIDVASAWLRYGLKSLA